MDAANADARAAGRAATGEEARRAGSGAVCSLAAHLVTLHYAHVACALIAPARANAERAARHTHTQSGSESKGEARAQRIRVDVFAFSLIV